MEIVSRHVNWWNGYDTLVVEDTPRTPTASEVNQLNEWISQTKPLHYVPVPFAGFLNVAPLRHYPHERWERCAESLGVGGFEGVRMLDVGCNTGYYAFLAAAAGAASSGIDLDPKAIVLVNRIAALHHMPTLAIAGDVEHYDWEQNPIDIVFAFSVLPYLGQNDPERLKTMLRRLAHNVGVSFIEMGDGGSELPWAHGDAEFEALFRECEFGEVTNLGSMFSSHTNTHRTLWRCDGE